jgi:hypothetical protein
MKNGLDGEESAQRASRTTHGRDDDLTYAALAATFLPTARS